MRTRWIDLDGTAPPRRAIGFVVACIALGACIAGCTDADRSGRGDEGRGVAIDGAIDDGRGAEEDSARIELVVEPSDGDAPLAVRMRATIVGGVGTAAGADDLGCATAAFSMGDGNVTHVRPDESPCKGGVGRTYEVEHVYASAGSFSASVRLIARPIPVSRIVPVLVRGATPTPVPMAAIPGPTIIIATSAPPKTMTPSTPTSAATSPPMAPLMTTPTAAEPSGPIPTVVQPSPIPAGPTDVASAMDSVLPADLYAISGDDGRIIRLPASGAALEVISEAPADDFAVSSLGLVAVLRGQKLDIVSPTGIARSVAESGPSAPVWSRNGRRLAYVEAAQLHLFDVVAFEDTEMGSAEEPIRFSRDGERLLIQDIGGEFAVVDSMDGTRLRLPIEPSEHAGWLPDADVLWLSGAGLRFVSLDPAISISTIITPEVATSAVFIRPDGHALVLADVDGHTRLQAIDLASADPRAESIGGPLPIGIDADVAWSPDGRWLAVAGSTGLILLDPVSGASVPLVDEPARQPRWSSR